MKHEILRIEPKSAIRVGFFFGFFSGVLLGFLEALMFRLLAKSVSGLFLPADMAQLSSLSTGAVIALAVVTGLFMSVLGSIVGVLGAFFYNAVVRYFGGLEVTLSEETGPGTSPHETIEESDDV